MEKALPIDLFCASANPLLLDGLRHLSALGNFQITGEARDVASTLASLKKCKPAILILDLDLTPQEDGLVHKCRLAHNAVKVVIVEGSTVDSALSPEIPAADAFLNRRQSMATLATRLESLCTNAPGS